MGSTPPPPPGEYIDSSGAGGHTQLSSVSSPIRASEPPSLNNPAPISSTLAATQNGPVHSSAMLATTSTDTSTTPSASHMPSYGTGLASPSAAAYGASSLSAYGSTYPYGLSVSRKTIYNATCSPYKTLLYLTRPFSPYKTRFS